LISITHIEVFENPDNKYFQELLWDVEGIEYYYISSGIDPNTNRPVLLVGGADTKFNKNYSIEESFKKLEKFKNDHFHESKKLTRWSSKFIKPKNYFPLIGECPNHKNTYFGTGFSGDGILYGTIAGNYIASKINDPTFKIPDLFDSKNILQVATLNNVIKEKK
jgi:glycine/D-amino acid oxidase-like deaminating enzyme